VVSVNIYVVSFVLQFQIEVWFCFQSAFRRLRLNDTSYDPTAKVSDEMIYTLSPVTFNNNFAVIISRPTDNIGTTENA